MKIVRKKTFAALKETAKRKAIDEAVIIEKNRLKEAGFENPVVYRVGYFEPNIKKDYFVLPF